MSSVRRFSILLCAMSFGVGLLLYVAPQAAMAVSICPAIGADTTCGVLIGIGSGGALSVSLTGQPAYDSIDDALIGITNNTTGPVSSVNLSGTPGSGIFGFDGDGICTYSFTGNSYCASLPMGSTGYEGPNNTFSNYSSGDTGTVNFTTALAAGGSTYFSLEGDPKSVAGALVPEPATLVLFGPALVGLTWLRRTRGRG